MCHVNELPRYQVAILFALCVPPSVSCHVVLRFKILQLLGYPSTTARRGC